MAGKRVHIVLDRRLLTRVDQARGRFQSRGSFVREALEQALGSEGGEQTAGQVFGAASPPSPDKTASRSPAPASARASSAALDRQALLNRAKGL